MRKMIIVDAGATKADWRLICRDDNGTSRTDTHTTAGINAVTISSGELAGIIHSMAAREEWQSDVERIYYYGAGCIGGAADARIMSHLSDAWREAIIEVASDLTGTARALHGDEPGVACILGTGSNSCMYDGKHITANIPPLGFILGDEGSGAALGKRLISNVFKEELPTLVRENFMDYIGMTLPEIIEHVYRRPNPGRFLASVVPFIKENIWNPYIYALVLKEMTVFIKRNVSKYDGARRHPLGFTGSIAWHFQEQLRDAAEACGYTVGTILQSPIDALVNYHVERW